MPEKNWEWVLLFILVIVFLSPILDGLLNWLSHF